MKFHQNTLRIGKPINEPIPIYRRKDDYKFRRDDLDPARGVLGGILCGLVIWAAVILLVVNVGRYLWK